MPTKSIATVSATLASFTLGLAAIAHAAIGGGQDPCAEAAAGGRTAEIASAEADLYRTIASAQNLPDPSDRQEFLLGEAEDAAVVVARGTQVSVPAGVFNGCLESFDFTPLESDLRENKSYATGIGVVLELDQTAGERLELISYTL